MQTPDLTGLLPYFGKVWRLSIASSARAIVGYGEPRLSCRAPILLRYAGLGAWATKKSRWPDANPRSVVKSRHYVRRRTYAIENFAYRLSECRCSNYLMHSPDPLDLTRLLRSGCDCAGRFSPRSL
jgi:hypothetical protein